METIFYNYASNSVKVQAFFRISSVALKCFKQWADN